jgi:hypothetical protein
LGDLAGREGTRKHPFIGIKTYELPTWWLVLSGLSAVFQPGVAKNRTGGVLVGVDSSFRWNDGVGAFAETTQWGDCSSRLQQARKRVKRVL